MESRPSLTRSATGITASLCRSSSCTLRPQAPAYSRRRYPDAHIPLVQISLNASLSPTLHYRIGQLLASLRTEGVMVLGSGQATHNMRLLMTLNDGAPPPNVDEYAVPAPAHLTLQTRFLAWLTRAVAEPSAAVRERLLLAWENAPHGREMHPREGACTGSCLHL